MNVKYMVIKYGLVSSKYRRCIFIDVKRNNYLIMKNILLLGALVMFAFNVSAQSDVPPPPTADKTKTEKACSSEKAEGEKAACSGKKDGDKACCAKNADGSAKTCTAEEKAACSGKSNGEKAGCCSKSADDKSSNSKSKEKGKKSVPTTVGLSE